MAYSKALAKDVEAILEKMALPNLISKKMFGAQRVMTLTPLEKYQLSPKALEQIDTVA